MSKEITVRALRGDRFDDLDIVDMHCHYRNSYCYYQPQASMEDMVKEEAVLGINTFCVCPVTALECDYKLGNRQSLEFVRKFPDKVYAYVGLNPQYAGEIEGELDKYYGESRFIGVKIHPSGHRAKINCEGYKGVFNAVARRGGFVLTHSWEACPYSNMDLCEQVIAEFPQVNIVLAHTGGTVEGAKKTISLVNRYPNAYLDTCGFDVTEHWINELVERCPEHKILFGTDFPYHDVRYGSTRILFADLEDEVKLRILGGNFRLLMSQSLKMR